MIQEDEIRSTIKRLCGSGERDGENLSEYANEVRLRLIHIEQKLDKLVLKGSASAATYAGSADQEFGFFTYSQHGEDLIIANVFKHIGVDRPSYLDIGAHHPLNISNTALFYQRGCRGVNVEANSNLIRAFTDLRPGDINLNVGVGVKPGSMTFYMIDDFSGRNTFDRGAAEAFVAAYPQHQITRAVEVPIITINQIVDEHCGGIFPDFLSIDVEGLDYDILESVDFNRGRPKVICAEVTSALGEKGGDIAQILKGKGYFVCFRTTGNSIFIDREYLSLLPWVGEQ